MAERQRILGFPVHKKGPKLYAVKRIAGKMVWIALGDTVEGAEEKIRAYCDKNGLDCTDRPQNKF